MAQRDLRGLSDRDLLVSWAEWIKRTAEDLIEVYHNRYVFLHVKAMVDTNPALRKEGAHDELSDSARFVLGWLARLYARDVLMFIRREFDTQAGTINLLQLLSQIEARPTAITRRHYRQLFDDAPVPPEVKDDLANHYFDTLKIVKAANAEDDHLSPEQAEDDRTTLASQIRNVLEFANRELAHRTPPWTPLPIRVPDDLDPPLDAICRTFNQYYPLLTGTSMPSPTPSIQFDWTECFRHAWATDEYYKTRSESVREPGATKAAP
jgi:hypothetical protein